MEKASMTYASAMLKAPDFWERGITGRGIKIGIVDHGQAEHIALPIAGGHACLNHTTYMYATGEHHTHCAGIALARNLKNGQPCGIAPEADNYVIRMYMATIETRVLSIIEAIDYAIEQKIDILSISQNIPENAARFTTDRTSSQGIPKHLRLKMREAFVRAERAGIIICISSSSNDDEIEFAEYLQKMPNVVNVSDNGFKGEEFVRQSTHHQWVDLLAPGNQIVSCYPNNKYGRMTGVSMSCPLVAGYFALYKQLLPDKSANEIIKFVKDNAVRTDWVHPKSKSHGLPQPPKELYAKPVTSGSNQLYYYFDYMWQAIDKSYYKQNNQWKEMEGKGYV